jgi:hypothetical protein
MAAPVGATAGRYPVNGYQRHYQGFKVRVIARPDGDRFDLSRGHPAGGCAAGSC